MKSLHHISAILCLSLSLPLSVAAANRKTTVTQVTSAVTITANVDYQITSTEPFSDEGSVNIENVEHAVVIFTQVKPSVVISQWLSKIMIDGAKAVNKNNCQVKLYNRGCIVLPYGERSKPLSVFSEQRYKGDTCNVFGLENSGGYMNTLSAAKLNNRIRSFKLKRGYMVTFSTLAKGRGYSRCFIAADKDLEMPTLPPVLDGKITSYRIFKWYDTGKQQLAASGGNTAACSALNVTSTYTWGTTSDMSPDVENVPHHIYENYPSPSDLGACTTSPHMKTNNEPMNTSDDPKGQTEDVDAVLANWQDLMATGMRLCSPSSWDGSDYTNGTGYIKRFIDSIDARGWRCDIIDLHCYWPESNFSTIRNWTTSTGRPVWISEWVWGASWNNNGAFASGVTESQNAEALKRICPVLNSNDCIERYYYWNGERDPSKLYKSSSLTEAGKYYASINSGPGYNGKYDFVPTTPPQYGPSKFTQSVTSAGKTRLTWYDANGEFNKLMEIQMQDENTGLWVVLDTIAQKEAAANYTYLIDNPDPDILYRLHLIDLNGREYYTREDITTGDGYIVDGDTLFVGGNIFTNGGFELGFDGWINGQGNVLAQPQFQIVGQSGFHGSHYLQAHTSGAISANSSIRTATSLEAGQNYLFHVATCNSGNYVRFALSANGTALSKVVAKATNANYWHLESAIFNSEDYTTGLFAAYTLAAKAQIDEVGLRRLFPTREEAFRDGIEKAKLRAEMQKQTLGAAYPELNADLDARLAAISGTDKAAYQEAEAILAEHLAAIEAKKGATFQAATLGAVKDHPCPNYEEMLVLLADIQDGEQQADVVSAASELKNLIDEKLAFSKSSKQPRLPSFAGEKSTGWTVKAGTFTGGDQRTATKLGKTCWNAWWSTTQQTATMEIKQAVTSLPEGFYQLECKGLVEHFCLTDQHGYLQSGGITAETPVMTKDYFDLPVDDPWETLRSVPIYVAEGGSLTLGFKSSKAGVLTGYWHKFGEASATSDNREGWWCATDFVLLYHPIDDPTGIEAVQASKLKIQDETALYDLSGRKVSHLRGDSEGAGNRQRGIYIENRNGVWRKIISVK